MNTDFPDPRRILAVLALGGLGLLAGGGCASFLEQQALVSGPEHQLKNTFRGGERLPRELKRVIVLPLTVEKREPAAESGREAMEAILLTELAKTGKFEVVPLAPPLLRESTGRTEWTTLDRFPTNFFQRLRETTGGDAVLFVHLTEYQPYPPMAIGWRVQLLDLDEARVWWAADEVFDTKDPVVANSARRYHQSHAAKPANLTDSGEVLNSPRRFANYTASALVATCPVR